MTLARSRARRKPCRLRLARPTPCWSAADGSYLYTLPSVVDDIDLGVTDVIRGEDHVTNTAVQIQITQALGGPVPRYGHHNLLTTAAGEGLSKRLGHLSLRSLREDGLEALAVATLAVLVGSAEAVRPRGEPRRARRSRSISAGSRARRLASTRRNCAGLNSKLLHHLPYEAVAPRLAGDGRRRSARRSGTRFAATSRGFRMPRIGRRSSRGDRAGDRGRCGVPRRGRGPAPAGRVTT